MALRHFWSAAALCLVVCSPAAGEDGVAWTSDADNNLLSDAIHYDDQVEPAQAAAQQSSNRSFSTRTASRGARTSRVPYMIGDQSSGLAGGLSFEGVDIASFEHPIFGGNRFNVAENNSPIPMDRVFVTYRHFENAYDTDILGQTNSLGVERFDLGFEKTALDGMVSAQLVVPLLRQLDTDLDIYNDGIGNSNLPLLDRHGELGNLAVNLKLLLCSRSSFAFTGGVAVNCPTADDARISQFYDEPDLVLVNSPFVSSINPTSITMNGRFDNDTVNLVPYLAWQVRPAGRFFHQGFLQVDAPLNRSNAAMEVTGQITPDSTYGAETFSVRQEGQIDQQSLLRLNLGFGYWLCQGGRGGPLRGVAGLFEAHYTSTLDNANPLVLPVTRLTSTLPSVNDVPLNLLAGPQTNNVDQVNLSAGLASYIGSYQVTNGVVVPVTDQANRSFDFEYSLQINRLF
jgi:hypothetical protein